MKGKRVGSITNTTIRVESITYKIQKEMSLFESGATSGNHLQKAFDYILSIRQQVWSHNEYFQRLGF